MLLIEAILLIGVIIGIFYWLFMSSYSQLFGYYPWKIKTDKKIVALTFDDGPNDPYTSQILDLLDDSGIKATFFLVGNCIEKFPDTVDRIFNSGHTIGNHSLSHEFKRYFKQADFKNEILDNQAVIRKYVGIFPALYRSPWLWRHPFIFRSVKESGLTPISGKFCHALEVLQIDGDKIAKSALRKAKPGTIIIFHDGKEGKGGNRSQTVKAVESVIINLKQNGYSFVTVDNLLKIPAYQET